MRKYYFIFDLIFYRTYKWQLRKYGKENNPVLIAFLAVNMIQSWNVMLLELVIFSEVLNLSEILTRRFMVFQSIIIMIVNYFLYYSKGKYNKVLKHFNHYSNKNNILIYYIVISIVSYFMYLLYIVLIQ